MMKYSISEDRLIDIVFSMYEKEIESYFLDELTGRIGLQDNDGKTLLYYVPQSRELWYDHSIREFAHKFMPFLDLDLFKDAAKKFFNEHFPDKHVKVVSGANIV